MDGATDAYRVLQVDPSADDFVIRAAYRALARRFHPDGVAPDPSRMAALNAAYAMVRDPQRRHAYDARRVMARSQAVPIDERQRRVEAWTPRQRAQGSAAVLDFGRYAGWTLSDLARHDPDYLRWLSRHSSGLRFREAILRLLPRDADLNSRSGSVA